MSDIIPVRLLNRRIAEQGRIRFGIKGPKGEPKAIEKLRFTSPDPEPIREIARLYGGKPIVWEPGRGRSEWEVITETSQVPIYLPPDPLGGTPIYELWSGGGLVRRCDGETCEFTQASPDGASVAERPCVCAAKEEMACKVVVRLVVLLPEIKPFGGGWRLETHSWNAAHELPGMVEMIQALQLRGLAKATLYVERRTLTKDGKTRHFVVPRLQLSQSAEELMGPQVLDQIELNAPAELEEPTELLLSQILLMLKQVNLDETSLAGFKMAVTDGDPNRPLVAAELRRIRDVLRRIAAGEVEFVGIDSRGYAMVTKVEVTA